MNKYKGFICLAFILFTGFQIYQALQNKINARPLEYLAPHIESRQSNNYIEKHLGPLIGPEILIDSEKSDGIKDPDFLKRLEKFVSKIEDIPHVVQTISILDIIKELNQVLNDDNADFFQIPTKSQSVAEILLLYSMGKSSLTTFNDRYDSDFKITRLSVLWTLKDSHTSLEYFEKIIQMGRDLA